MIVPGLTKSKDLDLCTYIQMMFMERLEFFKKDVVDVSPSIKTSGICGDIEKLQKNSLAVMKKLEEMKGKV